MPRDGSSDNVEWYDKLSSGYEELYGEEQSRKIEKILELAGDRKIGLAVDVACGTGMLLQKLEGTCDSIVGVDLSSQMLRKAKMSLGEGDVQLVRADCSALPLRNGVADYCFSVSLIEAKPEAETQLSELARITKPEGKLLVTVFHGEGGLVDLEAVVRKRVRYRVKLSPMESLFLL